VEPGRRRAGRWLTASGAIAEMLKYLRDIRTLRVAVVHPKDRDAADLLAQLRRIGCQAQAIWPPPSQLPEGTQLVFLSIRTETLDGPLRKSLAGDGTVIIGILEYENPGDLEAIVDIGAVGIVTKPIRAIGLLTNIVVGLSIFEGNKISSGRIRKLEARLNGIKRIEKAKSILMARNGVTESGAYATIRERAMAKRVSMDEVATAIIDANEVFNLG
jgi:AmiR/NasT family two-component response regulator